MRQILDLRAGIGAEGSAWELLVVALLGQAPDAGAMNTEVGRVGSVRVVLRVGVGWSRRCGWGLVSVGG